MVVKLCSVDDLDFHERPSPLVLLCWVKQCVWDQMLLFHVGIWVVVILQRL